ncbi:hypothetical protein [Streptomyces sp. NPDC048196]|uniref:hypothetical protein n=1 Tax=Streptomyces sp. NPDC048196 TaxID=3154712 RepID=UPI0033CFCE92
MASGVASSSHRAVCWCGCLSCTRMALLALLVAPDPPGKPFLPGKLVLPVLLLVLLVWGWCWSKLLRSGAFGTRSAPVC